MTPLQKRLREYSLGIFLHQRLHKSKKILMCESDMQLATEIVTLLDDGSSESGDLPTLTKE